MNLWKRKEIKYSLIEPNLQQKGTQTYWGYHVNY